MFIYHLLNIKELNWILINKNNTKSNNINIVRQIEEMINNSKTNILKIDLYIFIIYIN